VEDQGLKFSNLSIYCVCVCVCVCEREREREREDILECEIGGEIENLGKNLNNGAVER